MDMASALSLHFQSIAYQPNHGIVPHGRGEFGDTLRAKPLQRRQEGVRTDPVLPHKFLTVTDDEGFLLGQPAETLTMPHKGERLLADALLAGDGLMGSPFLWTVHLLRDGQDC
jgi:hypothetical protein